MFRLFLAFVSSFFLLLTPEVQAQSGMFVQYEPGLSYTIKTRSRWSFNGNTSMRYTFARPTENGTRKDSEFDYNETLLFATYELWSNIKVSGGYGFQIIEADDNWWDEHRIMEQMGFVLYARAGKRIANRMRLEHRIRGSGYENRWRYRLGFDSPLNGEQLDPGEMYVIITNEFLWSFNSVEQSGENRFYAGLGWFLDSRYKIETGFQYRIIEIGVNPLNTLWLTTSFYINKIPSQKKLL